MSSLNSCVRTRLVVVALCTTVLLATLPTATWAQRDLKPLSEEQIEKISEALPEKPTVKPAEPRKILIFWRCGGFFHGSIRVGNVTLKMLGEKTGAYEAVVSDDPNMFNPDKLNRFDAVIFNNTTQVKLDEKQRQALLDFVVGGKGIVGIHAATDNFYDWPEGAAMMGGLFAGHPWHEKVGVKIDDPDHPVVAAFGKKGFYITDEIYQFRDPYSRQQLRVLLSLGMSKTTPKGGREDNDYAVSWVHAVGKGRVFYCSLGHRDEIFWNPLILRHYLDGIQYALGDLKADATPSAKLAKQPTPALCLDE
jgi:type 1 glutamine amidotransferase